MFEKIANWSELLFPTNLLRSDSVVARMVSDIPEEDWTDAVKIIGWLYQYYNTELKDDTFALLKKNVKISKERIPAATQLFTPDWIVRYMNIPQQLRGLYRATAAEYSRSHIFLASVLYLWNACGSLQSASIRNVRVGRK